MPEDLSQEAIEIKAARDALGWTQEELAAYLGDYNRSTISEIERGNLKAHNVWKTLMINLAVSKTEKLREVFSQAGEEECKQSHTPPWASELIQELDKLEDSTRQNLVQSVMSLIKVAAGSRGGPGTQVTDPQPQPPAPPPSKPVIYRQRSGGVVVESNLVSRVAREAGAMAAAMVLNETPPESSPKPQAGVPSSGNVSPTRAAERGSKAPQKTPTPGSK